MNVGPREGPRGPVDYFFSGATFRLLTTELTPEVFFVTSSARALSAAVATVPLSVTTACAVSTSIFSPDDSGSARS